MLPFFYVVFRFFPGSFRVPLCFRFFNPCFRVSHRFSGPLKMFPPYVGPMVFSLTSRIVYKLRACQCCSIAGILTGVFFAYVIARVFFSLDSPFEFHPPPITFFRVRLLWFFSCFLVKSNFYAPFPSSLPAFTGGSVELLWWDCALHKRCSMSSNRGDEPFFSFPRGHPFWKNQPSVCTLSKETKMFGAYPSCVPPFFPVLISTAFFPPLPPRT